MYFIRHLRQLTEDNRAVQPILPHLILSCEAPASFAHVVLAFLLNRIPYSTEEMNPKLMYTMSRRVCCLLNGLLCGWLLPLGVHADELNRPSELPADVVTDLRKSFDPEADRMVRAALARFQSIETLPEFYLSYAHTRTVAPHARADVLGISQEKLTAILDGRYELMEPVSHTRIMSRLYAHDGEARRKLAFHRKSLLYKEKPPYFNEYMAYWDGQEAWSTSLSHHPDPARRSGRLWRDNDSARLHRIQNGWVMSRFVESLAVGDRKAPPSSGRSISPSQSRYKRAGEIDFLGSRCVVLNATDLDHRFFVELDTGRLAGMLTLAWQGRLKVPYWKAIDERLKIPKFDSREDFRDWFASLPYSHRILVGRDSGDYMNHDSGVEINITGLNRYSEYVVLKEGIELPGKMEFVNAVRLKDDPNRYHYSYSVVRMKEHRVVVKDAEFNAFLPDESYKGYDVYDDRFDTLIQYPYERDIPMARIRALLNEARRKKVKMEGLFEEYFADFDAMNGKPSPALNDGEWLGEAPKIEGRAHLIHFWATWCGPCKQDYPRLNAIASTMPVIGIHPSDTNRETVQKAVESAGLKYSIFHARQDEEGLVAGYPATIFPYAVLIDAGGRVAGHGSLQEVMAGLNARER